MKKSLKRALALCLSLCLLLSLTVPQALAADPPQSGTCGKNLKWSFDNGTLTISGKGAMPNYDALGQPWFGLAVKKLVLKEGVTSLGENAFLCLGQLSSLKLPKSLKKVGRDALTGTNLKAVGVTKGSKYFSAKGGVLFNKKKTTLVYYPSKRKGKSYTVPSSVTTIAAGAFSGGAEWMGAWNPYLKKLILPKKLKKIEAYAFRWSSIGTFKFPSGNPKIASGAFDGVHATILYPKKHKKCWTAALKAIYAGYPSTLDEDEDLERPSLTLKPY